jgi:hypothetical protein
MGIIVELQIKTAIERLADEGVPIAALARATQSGRDDIYGVLRDAVEHGRLTELPASDWPPGQSRKARIGSGRASQVDGATVLLLLMKTFEITRQQALLMREMLLRAQATREQLYAAAQQAHEHDDEDTEPKIVQVVICKLRKRLIRRALVRRVGYSVKINTIWSGGYYIDRKQRLAIFDTIKLVGNVEPES